MKTGREVQRTRARARAYRLPLSAATLFRSLDVTRNKDLPAPCHVVDKNGGGEGWGGGGPGGRGYTRRRRSAGIPLKYSVARRDGLRDTTGEENFVYLSSYVLATRFTSGVSSQFGRLQPDQLHSSLETGMEGDGGKESGGGADFYANICETLCQRWNDDTYSRNEHSSSS